MADRSACSVEGCVRDAAIRGWCHGHWQRAYRNNGDPGPATFRRRPNSEPPLCTSPGCVEPAHSRGWCAAHYQRWYDGRSTDTPIQRQPRRQPRPTCSIEGCEHVAKAKGWCNRHYQRWYRTGDAGPADIPRYGLVEVCSADGCDREHRTGGYCDRHYRRARRGLSPDSLTFLAEPRRADPNGYAATHRRIAQERGRASDHICACGARAQQWAYQHNDPAQLLSEQGMPYSLNIQACYLPMCLSCHNRLDRDLDRRAEAMRSAG